MDNFPYKDNPKEDKPDLQETIEALREATDSYLPATIFYGLSGIGQDELQAIRSVWNILTPDIRLRLLRRMTEISETDFEMDYRTIGLHALQDAEPLVREAAISVLWEDESTELLKDLEHMAVNDPAVEVRARALSELGRFILSSELGDCDEEVAENARRIASNIVQDKTQPILVRRRALEAIANCSHPIVPTAIREAYYSDDHQMRVGAVFAMGRTFDKQWHDIVITELEADDEEMRFEAARASGELEIRTAIPQLAKILTNDDAEIETKEIAIWALGEIGGAEAIRILEIVADMAEEDSNEEISEAVEEALGNASLVGGDLPFMLDIEEDSFDNDSEDAIR